MMWPSKPDLPLNDARVDHKLEDARLVDLSIDSAFELGLTRQRNVAVVELAISGVAIHRSARRYIKNHLVGRNPMCIVGDGSLTASFAIENHSVETLRQVNLFGEQLRDLLGAESVETFLATTEGAPGAPII